MKKTLVSLFLTLFCLSAIAGDYVVVVNSDNTWESISKAYLKRAFTGKIKEYKGVPLVPINLPAESQIASDFLNEIVKMNADMYKEFWVDQQVKGLGTAPMIQKNAAMVKAIVSQLPGAIGYIPSKELDDTVKQLEVK